MRQGGGRGAQSKERKGSNFAIWQPCPHSLLPPRLHLDSDVVADGAAHDDLVVGLEVVEVLDDLALVAELMHEAAAMVAGPVVEGQLGRAVDVGLDGALGALRNEPVGRVVKNLVQMNLVHKVHLFFANLN